MSVHRSIFLSNNQCSAIFMIVICQIGIGSSLKPQKFFQTGNVCLSKHELLSPIDCGENPTPAFGDFLDNNLLTPASTER